MGRISNLFVKTLDLFYPLFKRWMSKEVYHYLACGTINTLSDWCFYYLIYNYIVKQHIIQLTESIAISAHIASLILVTPITFTIGFLFSKYITFSESNLKTSNQILRYASVLTINFIMSYLCMKLLCDGMGLWATPAKMATTIITTIISFFLQKYFSFKKTKNE